MNQKRLRKRWSLCGMVVGGKWKMTLSSFDLV